MVDDSHQKVALGVVVAFPILGGIAVVLRSWSRFMTGTRFGPDTGHRPIYHLVVLSVCTSSGYLIVHLTDEDIKTNYVGIHEWDIPADYNIKTGLIWNFANQLIYNPCLTMVKLSILFFLRRLESQSRTVNLLIWSTTSVTILLFFAVLFVDIFQCHPIAYVYDTSLANGTCINEGAFYVATAAINLFTDILVVSIPTLITLRLHMPWRKKLAVCVILCMGLVATAIGIWRIILLANGFFPTHPVSDPTYAIGFCSSAVEVHVAVVAACAPCLKAVVSRYWPRLFGTTDQYSSGKNMYGYGYGRSTSTSGFRPRSTKKGGGTQNGDGNGDGGIFELAVAGRPRQTSAEMLRREMRKYHVGVEAGGGRNGSVDLSLSSEEGILVGNGGAIVKRMDVQVQVSRSDRSGSVEEEEVRGSKRHQGEGSVDCLV